MTNQKLVLFDVDYTLVDVGTTHGEVFSEVFKKYFDIDISPKECMLQGHTDLQILHKIVDEHKKDLDPKLIASIIQDMIARFQSKDLANAKLLEGVSDLLRDLKKQDAVIGLVTGNIRDIAYSKLKHFAINEYFILGGFGQSSTIRSDLVEAAIKQAHERGFSVTKEDVFIIGDTPLDIKAAKEAGVKVIAVATGENSKEDLASHKPDYLFSSLSPHKPLLDVIFT